MGWIGDGIGVTMWAGLLLIVGAAWLAGLDGRATSTAAGMGTFMLTLIGLPIALFCMAFAGTAFGFIEELEDNKRRAGSGTDATG